MAKAKQETQAPVLENMSAEELLAYASQLQYILKAAEADKDEAVKEYQELLDEHNQLKQDYESLLSGSDTPADKAAPASKAPVIPTDTFEANGGSYKMALPAISIKGLGKRTALEILTDEETYDVLGGKTIRQHLVDSNSIAVVKA